MIRRLIIFITGMVVLIAGIVSIVLPTPAMLLIPLGIAILAGEFAWAKRLQKRTDKVVDDKVCRKHAESRIGKVVCRRKTR